MPGQGQGPAVGRGTVPEQGQGLDAGQELGGQVQAKDPAPDWGQVQDAGQGLGLARGMGAALEQGLDAVRVEGLGQEYGGVLA